VVKDRFQEDSAQHDSGDKTILGRKGAWKGDDLLRIVLAHPATAERLAVRLCELFMGEGAVDAVEIKSLGAGLRQHNLDIGWAVETVLRSKAFFAEANLGTRILGPVEYVVGAARALELFDPSPNTLILAEFSGNLGMDLFHPPNVGGWPGGRSWISTRSAIGRYNYANALHDGENVGLPGPVDALGLAQRQGRGNSLESIVLFYTELLLGAVPSSAWHKQQLTALGPKAAVEPTCARRIAALILASPEAQLG
jgi:uncharacterized protein (DUF1800 family)